LPDRYFKPGDVRALIPALTEIMEGVMAANEGAAEARESLRAEQQRITFSGGGVLDADRWRAARGRLQSLTARIETALEEIGRLGGVTKDLGLGLVDFPHLRDGRVVNLCWKYGERDIGFWHGLDEGFAARKPL